MKKSFLNQRSAKGRLSPQDAKGKNTDSGELSPEQQRFIDYGQIYEDSQPAPSAPPPMPEPDPNDPLGNKPPGGPSGTSNNGKGVISRIAKTAKYGPKGQPPASIPIQQRNSPNNQ